MENINSIILEYLSETEKRKAAEKREKALKDLIIAYAGNLDNFTTDIYTVVIKTTTSSRLDTVALYHDFPDIKETYGRTTTSKSITAVATSSAAKKTA